MSKLSGEFSKENLEGKKENEILEAMEAVKTRRSELQEQFDYYKEENAFYKARCEQLEQRLANTTDCLEKNAKIFYDLFSNFKNGLQKGRTSTFSGHLRDSSLCSSDSQTTISSPNKANILNSKSCYANSKVHMITNQKCPANPKPGPSGVTTKRPKFNIQPFKNMVELQQSFEAEESLNSEVNLSREALSVISEENTVSSSPTTIVKQLQVRVSRLPSGVVKTHLEKQHSFHSDLSSDVSTFFLTSNTFSERTSTPLQLEHMRQGDKFVNIRKHQGASSSGEARKRRTLMKEEKSPIVIKKKKIQSKIHKTQQSEKENTTQVREENQRPTRKGKPKSLKEISLKTKLRREN